MSWETVIGLEIHAQVSSNSKLFSSASTEFGKKPNENVSLENIGFDIVGATAILNVGSFKTYTKEVLTHNGNMFTYEPVDLWKTKHHDYFLEGKLDFLDSEGEWFYNTAEDITYYYSATNPNDKLMESGEEFSALITRITANASRFLDAKLCLLYTSPSPRDS